MGGAATMSTVEDVRAFAQALISLAAKHHIMLSADFYGAWVRALPIDRVKPWQEDMTVVSDLVASFDPSKAHSPVVFAMVVHRMCEYAQLDALRTALELVREYSAQGSVPPAQVYEDMLYTVERLTVRGDVEEPVLIQLTKTIENSAFLVAQSDASAEKVIALARYRVWNRFKEGSGKALGLFRTHVRNGGAASDDSAGGMSGSQMSSLLKSMYHSWTKDDGALMDIYKVCDTRGDDYDVGHDDNDFL